MFEQILITEMNLSHFFVHVEIMLFMFSVIYDFY